MSQNVAYCLSNQPEWIVTASLLQEQLGWQPRYWVTRSDNYDTIGRAFPAATLHAKLDLNRGIPPDGCEHFMCGSLSKTFLDQAQPNISMAVEILDRVDLGRSFSFQERMRLIHTLLIYWMNVIEDHNLERAVFSAPPHAIGEYLLYSAMTLLGHSCRIFVSTPVSNLHFVSDSVERLPPHLISAFQTCREEGAAPAEKGVLEHLENIRKGTAVYKPWYVHDVMSREARYDAIRDVIAQAHERGEVEPQPFVPDEPLMRKQNGLNPIKGLWKRQASETIVPAKKRPKDEEPLPRAFKLPGRPISASFLTRGEYRNYRQWAMLRKIRLNEIYDGLCSEVDLDKPYIYYAMHYQPERTTCPEGGYFSNQFLAISVLADALPDNWSIYVKEHPSQFRYNTFGEMSRWEQYYDDIKRLKSVRFVRRDVPSFELIDRSQAIATITGAVGWEALIRSKPVLCFGNPWYGACSGAFLTRGKEDAAEAFAQISKGVRPNFEDVTAYAAALERISKPVFTTPTARKNFKREVDLAKSFFELLTEFENQS